MGEIIGFGGKRIGRAPKGGFTHPVNGKGYKGGQFCPAWSVSGGSEGAAPPPPTIDLHGRTFFGIDDPRFLFPVFRRDYVVADMYGRECRRSEDLRFDELADADSPIVVVNHYDNTSIRLAPEEEEAIRPTMRAWVGACRAKLDARLEARKVASPTPGRTFEEARADRARNLAKHGLSDEDPGSVALTEAERTPPRPPTADRNPGGRCQECGYTHGHRMDCCFI